MEETVKCSEIFIPTEVLGKWQKIVDLLGNLIQVPVCLIMRLLDPEIEVFTSSDNPQNPYVAGTKEHIWNSGLYCETVIKTRMPLQVIDARNDEKWCKNPDIKLGLIAYYGLPIMMPDGAVFGTMCVLDYRPREFSLTEKALLASFRDVLQEHLDLYYMNYVLGEKNKLLRDYLTELKNYRNTLLLCPVCLKIQSQTGEPLLLQEFMVKHPKTLFCCGPTCSSCLSPKKSV